MDLVNSLAIALISDEDKTAGNEALGILNDVISANPRAYTQVNIPKGTHLEPADVILYIRTHLPPSLHISYNRTQIRILGEKDDNYTFFLKFRSFDIQNMRSETITLTSRWIEPQQPRPPSAGDLRQRKSDYKLRVMNLISGGEKRQETIDKFLDKVSLPNALMYDDRVSGVLVFKHGHGNYLHLSSSPSHPPHNLQYTI